jgi:hypothetical protein
MKKTYDVLILGAAYGSLLGAKLVLAGHRVRLVCRAANADLINLSGIRIRLPTGGKGESTELDTREFPGKLSASTPADLDPRAYDLVALAMQEPQYRSAGVRELLGEVARARVPCMSIMNMPPPPYLKRIPALDVEALAECYTDATVWRDFEPACMTLCSPDPQAFRPAGEAANILQVTLPTNFKAASFDAEERTAILRELQADIEAVRYGEDQIELPVKLKVHDSIFVPLAKWAMLLTGNYRCVQKHSAIAINDAVHGDSERSRLIYDWVCDLCLKLGASADDLVPFEKYAGAARGLTAPSSAARALFAGATHIERVDRLVQAIAAQIGMSSAAIDEIVTLVDARVALNRETQMEYERHRIPS